MERIIFTALFSCCLSGLMSGWVTFINLGITDTFLSDWSMAFIKAYPMAFVAAYGLVGSRASVSMCIPSPSYEEPYTSSVDTCIKRLICV